MGTHPSICGIGTAATGSSRPDIEQQCAKVCATGRIFCRRGKNSQAVVVVDVAMYADPDSIFFF